MKPTISNAFNDGSSGSNGAPGAGPIKAKPRKSSTDSHGTGTPASNASGVTAPRNPNPAGDSKHPHRSLAASLASMQVDLRETEFGWSLELTPMSAIDALGALSESSQNSHGLNYLVSVEQSAWRDGDAEMPISAIVRRLCISPIATISDEQLVLDEVSLRQLVSLCQPTRLLVVAVEGPIEPGDATAMNRAIDAGQSPLLAEVRAQFALEVLGDRNIVLHSRSRKPALELVAENFCHYLAALTNKCALRFSAPQYWHIERLLDETGVLTIRPIETEVMASSVDVGVNTSRQRFDKPANRSLIYDVPSDTWHDEP